MSQCISSSNAGTFCISSTIIGRSSLDECSANTSSLKFDGCFRYLKYKSVFNQS
ncbi:hypothetical protein [Candidatus Tisiphia endosymbiont of Empis tessellata]|uniref:hypothetical protein n=1 Tax=Candidatus Tisiphia endosymbiont of Empis tessellata TaxID=3066259 RepID=UPI00313CF7C1